jgi:hypothetical protein
MPPINLIRKLLAQCFVTYHLKGCHAERSEASGLIKERFFVHVLAFARKRGDSE